MSISVLKITSTTSYYTVDFNSKNYYTDNCADFGQVRNTDTTCNPICTDAIKKYILPPDNISVEKGR